MEYDPLIQMTPKFMPKGVLKEVIRDNQVYGEKTKQGRNRRDKTGNRPLTAKLITSRLYSTSAHIAKGGSERIQDKDGN